MAQISLQETSLDVWKQKYQLKDHTGNALESTPVDTFRRVSKALASVEKDTDGWTEKFQWAMENGAIPAGRILSNAGAEAYKPSTSLINCTVSSIVEDSMKGILTANLEAGLTLAAGCGIGYEFSTLRPRGAYVNGAGATTSGSISFMDIFNSMCFTVSSAGGRRGAQMGTLAVWHPDVEEFIKAKREDGRLRQFNLSVLIDEDFLNAIENDEDYKLIFPIKRSELNKGIHSNSLLTWKRLMWEQAYCESQDYIVEDGSILCKVFKVVKAKALFDTIMRSTYDYAEPGFILIDRVNEMNNNWFCENIRASNPCGEQMLPPYGSCLLGSVDLTKMVKEDRTFDWDKYAEVVEIFTRMLDNVVELNGLPLEKQREEITAKRRHGMGITGLGSALAIMGIRYGSPEAVEFTEQVCKQMAVIGYKAGLDLAIEKGPAPLLADINNRELWLQSGYMKVLCSEYPELRGKLLKHGCRFTHHTSIAPTGTMSLSVCNNVSNGIEPTFAHKYTRNVIKEGEKAKRAVDVLSYEALFHKAHTGNEDWPEAYVTTDDLTPTDHLLMQAAAQKWVDSSISKTINVPTDIGFEEFKDIYWNGAKLGLKGVTTFRFNPDAFQGVLVKESDLEATQYTFVLEDGSTITAKGNDRIEYDGGEYSAANLFDALKEGYYGKF